MRFPASSIPRGYHSPKVQSGNKIFQWLAGNLQDNRPACHKLRHTNMVAWMQHDVFEEELNLSEHSTPDNYFHHLTVQNSDSTNFREALNAIRSGAICPLSTSSGEWGPWSQTTPNSTTRVWVASLNQNDPCDRHSGYCSRLKFCLSRIDSNILNLCPSCK